MPKYTETQSRKVISSYGGVESIIETPKGALKIELFDQWPFFKAIKEGKLDPQKFIIEDNRLLKRLQNRNGYPKLKEFLEVPTNQSNPDNKSVPSNTNKVISATYFPTWFYCNNCEGFNNLNSWWDLWKKVVQKHGETAEKEKYIPPKCPKCYDKARNANKIDGKRRRFYYDLEQVRFIMTAPSGDIRDVPWERWNNVIKSDSEDEGTVEYGGRLKLDFDKLCCDNQELQYFKSTKFSDLTGIRIACKNCSTTSTLSGFFGMRLRVPNETDVYYKPVLRTSNSCYYPVLISSIYLPTKRVIDIEDQKAIRQWHVEGENVEFMFRALRRRYEIEVINSFIQGEIISDFEPENVYRLKEYKFLLDEESKDRSLIYDRIPIGNLEIFGLSHLIAIRRLKVTSVQIAYTRQEPLENDKFLSGDQNVNSIKAKYTSKWKNQTDYLPAIESFGEGIFLALDSEKVQRWFSANFTNQDFKKRISKLFENAKYHERLSIQLKFEDEKSLARFVLIHTLSHILIKELEFLCGYPSTSLNERLFVDQGSMNGVMIYTVAGTEGSYGGLVSQADEPSFTKLLKFALHRANDCASDPICSTTEDGQGVGGLNMAACYSCTLIPENACEEFNSFLDRSLLIDNEYGYFKDAL